MDITDITRAGYLPITDQASMANVNRPAVPFSRGGAAPALDAVVSSYADRMGGWSPKSPGVSDLPGVQAQGSASVAASNQQALLDRAMGMMYETVGGPNQALINQLAAQKAAYLKNYQENRANVTNLYGAVSEEEGVAGTGLIGDIQSMGQDLVGQYGADISAMQESATKRAEGITSQQEIDAANRARAAEKLGIAIETLQSPNQVDYSGIRAESDAASANWENLFTANKLLAEEGYKAQIAGAGASKINHLTAMKSYLDQQNAAIDSQIALEKSKTATQQLTDLGKLLSGAMNEQTLAQLQGTFPEIFGAGAAANVDKYTQNKQDMLSYFNNMGRGYNLADLDNMITNINNYNAIARGGGGAISAEQKAPLSNDERILAELMGYSLSN